MNAQVIAEICNKLTSSITALEKLTKGEKVPEKFLISALEELRQIPNLLRESESS